MTRGGVNCLDNPHVDADAVAASVFDATLKRAQREATVIVAIDCPMTGHTIVNALAVIHTDLQQITVEMMERLGFDVLSRADFHIPRTIANLNTRSRKYRTDTSAIESALIFSAPRS